MGTTTTEALAIGLLVLLSAVYSGTESALFSLSEVKLRSRLETEGKLPRMLHLWLEEPNKVLASILIGNNLSNITASALATDLAYQLMAETSLGGRAGPISIAVGAMTLLILICGEVVPKTVAKHHPERLLMFLPLIRVSYLLFYLPTRALVWVTRGIVRPFGGDVDSDGVMVTEEDIENMVRIGKQDGSIDPEATRLLTGVLELDDRIAKDIMVPRTEVVGLPLRSSIPDVIERIREAGFSRYPVYQENLDHIVGVLYAKDLLVVVAEAASRAVAGSKPEFEVTLSDLIRKPMIRPAVIDIQKLLIDMKRDRVHMVMLASEYGGIDGLVTLEDIVEEVFGPIYDEHDRGEAIRPLSDHQWYLAGVCTLTDLRNDCGVKIEEDEDYGTVAGLLMKAAGTVPEKGYVHEQDGWRFEVLSSDETRVIEVLLRPSEPAPPEAAPEPAAAEEEQP